VSPRWIEDAKSLVAKLPQDAQDAIAAAVTAGRFDSAEFEAANAVFESQFVARTPRSQRLLPVCESTPVRFNAELYEYMWGPSEFLSTGTLRDYDRIYRLAEISIPTLFLVGEFDEARPETMLEFQARVPGSVVKVIPDAAHMVNVDQSAAFNKAVDEFLAAVEAR
jgi:proline iminopeptidase